MSNTNEVRDIPSHIDKNYYNVSLYIDVVYVNGIMFRVGASKHIDLIQCVCIRKKHCANFLKAILLMIREYRAKRVFNVISINADKAIDLIKSKLEDKLCRIALTTCDANQQLDVVERMIRFVKERIQVVRLAMLYTTMPSVLQLK